MFKDESQRIEIREKFVISGGGARNRFKQQIFVQFDLQLAVDIYDRGPVHGACGAFGYFLDTDDLPLQIAGKQCHGQESTYVLHTK